MKNDYKPLIVAVFLVVVGLGMRSLYGSGRLNSVKAPVVFIDVAQAQANGVELPASAALVQDGGIVMDGAVGGQAQIAAIPAISAYTYTSGAVRDPGQPIGQAIDPAQAVQYTVERGDTLSSIATHFDLSVATILSANANIRKKSLQVGMTLEIPDGVTNGINQTLPNLDGDFAMPAQGNDDGTLDNNNGVDIVNSCGTPVVAAADGIVVPDTNISDSLDGWNDGYGNFVLLQHAFGNDIFTRYAHLEQSLVQVGAYVKQGQEIGLMGQTGGATACELDFEVIGAQNPFGK